MPREINVSAGVVATNSPPARGGPVADVPLTSPLTFDKPGTYYKRFPAGVAVVTAAIHGPGAEQDIVTPGTGGQTGGGSGSYAEATFGSALWASGGYLIIRVGGYPEAGGAFLDSSGVHSTVGGVGISCNAGSKGSDGGFGGTLANSAGAGYTLVTSDAGVAGAAAAGKAGGLGGSAPDGGGKGGNGGASGYNGSDGVAPGGGPGGGGGSGGRSGRGAPGRVVITW